MLRRRAKRAGESNAAKISEESKKNRAVIEERSDVESHLEKLLFGDASSLDIFSKKKKDYSSDSEEEDEHIDHTTREERNAELDSDQRKPKWIDDDDEFESVDITAEAKLKKLRDTEDEIVIGGHQYAKKLRRQFEKIYGDGSWASLDKKKTQESDDEEDGMLQRTGNYLASQSEVLPKGIISIKKVKDANSEKPSNAGIHCLEFHPSAKVLLTAGFNKTLDLFQIDGQKNPKLQSVFIDHFPIYNAQFTADGEQVIMTSRRKYFYVYDMMKGQVTKIPGIRGRSEKMFEKCEVSPDGKHVVFLGDNGYMILVSSKSKQWIGNLKMNGKVGAVSFSPDGSKLYSTGSDGEVYIWDINSRTCLHKFTDEGCLNGTTISASRNGQYLACGSDSGVVNIYDDQCYTKSHPTPLKSITNLTTSIDGTSFNSTSELLAISSKYKRDAFKLVHMPSFTVFSNWPTSKTPLRYVQSFGFSPNSGFLSVGNDKGKALLYRLNHFTDS